MSVWDDDPNAVGGGWQGFFFDRRPLSARIMSKFTWWMGAQRKARIVQHKLLELAAIKPAIARAQPYWQTRQVDFSHYKRYQPVRDLNPDSAPPEIIDAEFQQRVAQCHERIQILQQLVQPWGIELDGDPYTLDALELWFCQYVHLFSLKEFKQHVRTYPDPDGNPYQHRTTLDWYSVGLDMNLYILACLHRQVSETFWGISKPDSSRPIHFNRTVLVCPADSGVYFHFEQKFWVMLADLRYDNHYFIPNKQFSTLSREYKINVTRCERILKSKTKHPEL